MDTALERRLGRLDRTGAALLRAGRMGLEKESLRVNPQGRIAQTPHPTALGSALTHPWITTDYSEALLELITPPCGGGEEVLAFLHDLHRFVYRRLDQEILWATSMPCVLEGGKNIPIAEYGRSNPGLMKHVYRRGLGYRYGRSMQVIAGVHFNYSLAEGFWPLYRELEGSPLSLREFADDAYFGLIRNLQRFGWLIPYLFGASPAVCRSFLGGRETSLQDFDAGTCYEPFATSLRMGDIGYTNRQEEGVGVKALYDNLDIYVASLRDAIETPCPRWQQIGVVVDGEYRQLNANILQIENEYYSTVRPKQPLEGLEKPTHALQQRGVRYIELRSLDVNAYHPLGVSMEQLRFAEALMLFCLLSPSPPIKGLERREIDQNLIDTAHRGRDPQLMLQRGGTGVRLREWALELLGGMQGVCAVLDGEDPWRPYSQMLAEQVEVSRDPDRTPSARMLAEMRANGEGFFGFAWRMSHQHRSHFGQDAEGPVRPEGLDQIAAESIARQRALEAEPQPPFGEFLDAYLRSP